MNCERTIFGVGLRPGLPLVLALLSVGCGRINYDPLASDDDAGGIDDAGPTCVMRVDNQPPIPAFDCARIEDIVLSGNVALVSDAELIEWARNDCMKKPAPAVGTSEAAASFSVRPGSGPDCASGQPPGSEGTSPNFTYAGSGTLELGSFSGNCGDTNLLGTFEQIQFATISTSRNVNTHFDGCRNIHIESLGGTANLQAFDSANGSASPHPIFVKMNGMGGTSKVAGSSEDDVVVVVGNASGNTIQTLSGNDTIVVGGALVSDDAVDTFLELGDGDDTAYIRELGLVSAPNGPEMDVLAGPGNDRIYFNIFDVEDINGGAGDDILSCTGLFGIPRCTRYGEWAGLRGGGGNDIISVDGPLIQTPVTGGQTQIEGGAGFNIVYVASIDNTSNSRVSIAPGTTGSSLVILGGDHITAVASTITASGADNVLLTKAGATNTGFTFNGFARTLNY